MTRALYRLGCFRSALVLARVLPRPALQRLAAFIGRAAYRRCPEVAAALRGNLQTLTHLESAALEELCARNVTHFSQMLADYFYSLGRPPAAAKALLHEWRGMEHFETAQALGKGIVLVTGHLGNWELGGLLLALRGLRMTVVTLEEPSSELTRWRDRFRRQLGIKTITVGPGHDFAFVEMIQTLRRNEILAMLVDRPYAGTGTTVQFCGRATGFSTAPALLWQHTGAAIVPAFVLREAGGGYLSFADAPLPFATGSDPRTALSENTQRLASHFEAIIRQHPEQWFHYVPIWNSAAASPT